jgi:hypothetical protein
MLKVDDLQFPLHHHFHFPAHCSPSAAACHRSCSLSIHTCKKNRRSFCCGLVLLSAAVIRILLWWCRKKTVDQRSSSCCCSVQYRCIGGKTRTSEARPQSAGVLTARRRFLQRRRRRRRLRFLWRVRELRWARHRNRMTSALLSCLWQRQEMDTNERDAIKVIQCPQWPLAAFLWTLCLQAEKAAADHTCVWNTGEAQVFVTVEIDVQTSSSNYSINLGHKSSHPEIKLGNSSRYLMPYRLYVIVTYASRFQTILTAYTITYVIHVW